MASRAYQFFPVIIGLAALLGWPGISPAAVRYSVAPISPSSSNSYLQDFNDSSRVAFLLDNAGKKVVMTYRAGDLDQLSPGTMDAGSLQLNKFSDAVWESDSKAFRYTFATDAVAEVKAGISNLKFNDKGTMLWSNDWQDIIMYKDGKEKIVAEYEFGLGYLYYSPSQMNNNDQFVWNWYGHGEWAEYYFHRYYFNSDGKDTCIWSADTYGDFNPQLNDFGHVVYTANDGIGKDADIFYWDGSSTKNISLNDDVDDANPRINNSGQVVWQGKSKTTGHTDIFLWDKGVLTNLSNTPDYDEANPVINSLGMVAWNGFDGHDQEIYLYYKDKIQLTKNYGYNDTNPLINARGEIAWDAAPLDPASTALKNAVYLAKPLADTYTYYYKYGSTGEYYSGTVYANPGIPYYLGYMFYKKNETGDDGYYKISGFDYTGDFSLYGQVTVDKYYDAESKRSFKPVHAGQAVGTNYLGSELDSLSVSGIKECQFGKGYYEGDVYDTYTFRYTYGNGDYYEGIVYRNPAEEYYQGWKAVTRNELKVDGYYEILAMAYTGKTAQYKKVYVTRYYDGETKKYLTLVPPATGYFGNNLLSSETGYVISTTSTHYFGKGYYEADE